MINQKLVQQDLSRKGRVSFATDKEAYFEKIAKEIDDYLRTRKGAVQTGLWKKLEQYARDSKNLRAREVSDEMNKYLNHSIAADEALRGLYFIFRGLKEREQHPERFNW